MVVVVEKGISSLPEIVVAVAASAVSKRAQAGSRERPLFGRELLSRGDPKRLLVRWSLGSDDSNTLILLAKAETLTLRVLERFGSGSVFGPLRSSPQKLDRNLGLRADDTADSRSVNP